LWCVTHLVSNIQYIPVRNLNCKQCRVVWRGTLSFTPLNRWWSWKVPHFLNMLKLSVCAAHRSYSFSIAALEIQGSLLQSILADGDNTVWIIGRSAHYNTLPSLINAFHSKYVVVKFVNIHCISWLMVSALQDCDSHSI